MLNLIVKIISKFTYKIFKDDTTGGHTHNILDAITATKTKIGNLEVIEDNEVHIGFCFLEACTNTIKKKYIY